MTDGPVDRSERTQDLADLLGRIRSWQGDPAEAERIRETAQSLALRFDSKAPPGTDEEYTLRTPDVAREVRSTRFLPSSPGRACRQPGASLRACRGEDS